MEGEFVPGNTVSIVNESGEELARGLSHYASDEIQKILGCHSDEIETRLGHKAFDEVVHRDDLVIFGLEANDEYL